jgi:hypothetical protein
MDDGHGRFALGNDRLENSMYYGSAWYILRARAVYTVMTIRRKEETTMGAGKRIKRYVRKLAGIGEYSLYITLPKPVLRELRWRKGQKVVVRRSSNRIIIEDWKP